MSGHDSVYHVERQVLHTAMMRPSSIADMPLLPRHFASEQHSQLWEIIIALDAESRPIDPVSVSDAADRAGLRSVAEIPIAIASSPDLYPASNPRYPADTIIAAWRDREAAQIAQALSAAVKRRDDGCIDVAIQALMGLHDDRGEHERTAREAMQAALDQASAARASGGRLIGVHTGIHDLDDTLGGLHDGDLIVIGARPAMGKTGLLLSMTAAGACSGGVGLISGEQPYEQVGLRWLAAGSHVSLGRLRAGKFGRDDVSAMDHAAEKFGELPIRIMDKSSPDITDVLRVARRWKHKYGIRCLYIDYLQKLEIASIARAPKHERIGAIAKCLKNLARELRIPVVALAQVNRDADDVRPQMRHLSDSSEIEKEADQIMMLWRDLSNPHAERTPAEINVVKNRHGNIGTVHCTWHGGSTSFVSRSADEQFGDA